MQHKNASVAPALLPQQRAEVPDPELLPPLLPVDGSIDAIPVAAGRVALADREGVPSYGVARTAPGRPGREAPSVLFPLSDDPDQNDRLRQITEIGLVAQTEPAAPRKVAAMIAQYGLRQRAASTTPVTEDTPRFTPGWRQRARHAQPEPAFPTIASPEIATQPSRVTQVGGTILRAAGVARRKALEVGTDLTDKAAPLMKPVQYVRDQIAERRANPATYVAADGDPMNDYAMVKRPIKPAKAPGAHPEYAQRAKEKGVEQVKAIMAATDPDRKSPWELTIDAGNLLRDAYREMPAEQRDKFSPLIVKMQQLTEVRGSRLSYAQFKQISRVVTAREQDPVLRTQMLDVLSRRVESSKTERAKVAAQSAASATKRATDTVAWHVGDRMIKTAQSVQKRVATASQPRQPRHKAPRSIKLA